MPIIFASVCPHPPIIVPEVGGEEVKKVKKTIQAMEKLSEIFNQSKPNTVIIISPHGLIDPDRFNLSGQLNLYGDFLAFGTEKVSFNFKNNLEIAEKIEKEAKKQETPVFLYKEEYQLDHGTMVPLYYLTKDLKEIKVLPIAYSYLSREIHYQFGRIIGEIVGKEKERIALIASGDLSHRLTLQAPAGYTPLGKEFDQKLIDLIQKKDIQGILSLEENFIEEAGECGYRSILILLGALDKAWQPEVLSYEGPFGVGYLVVNFKFGI